jgi:hypothetical protein
MVYDLNLFGSFVERMGLDDGGPLSRRRAVLVISTPNISLFDRNATPQAADRG